MDLCSPSRLRPALPLALLAVTQLLGCGPGLEVTVEDTTANAFRWEATFEGATGSRQYDWGCAGSKAVVRWEALSLSAGVVYLKIADAEGALVFDGAAPAAPENEVTLVGVPGGWKITVEYVDAQGALELSVLSFQ